MSKSKRFFLHHLVDFSLALTLFIQFFMASDSLKAGIFWICAVIITVTMSSSLIIFLGAKSAPQKLTSPMKERQGNHRYIGAFIDGAVALMLALIISPVLGVAWGLNSIIVVSAAKSHNRRYYAYLQSQSTKQN